MRRPAGIIAQALLVLCVLRGGDAAAQDCPPLDDDQQAALLEEHLFGGPPSDGKILIRRGYVTEYDFDFRVPRWVAWRVIPEYLNAPKRTGRWARFRTDPDIANPVVNEDYDGVLDEFGYARGHIAPYFVSGGDRDNDGRLAAATGVTGSPPIDDIDDACTVFEINFMSNIAPQLHSEFNGSGGLWNKLETAIRTRIVGGAGGRELHIIAGTVFGDQDAHVIGPDEDIFVPHMFYMILISEAGVAPFLFAHEARIGPKGCALDAELETCIVAVGDIERLTDLDFFAGLNDSAEAQLEETDGLAVWDALMAQ